MSLNILTIDLEDWFHILDVESSADPGSWNKFESRVEKNAERILKELDERNIKATWFCLGWIAERYPSLVKLVSQTHDIGCHSMYHQLLYSMSREEIRKDIETNVKQLEDLTGKKVHSYRAPGFSFTKETPWLMEELFKSGIRYDCSVFPAARNHGGIPGFPAEGPCRIVSGDVIMNEFPMSVVSLGGKRVAYSGGGYFRLLPYPVLDRIVRRSSYNMTYFHPRDFDDSQPVLPGLSLKRKFMSYTGLKNSFSKFIRLLNDHTFVSVAEAGSKINWNETPLVQMNKL